MDEKESKREQRPQNWEKNFRFDFTPEERTAMGKKGGQKSGETRRRQRTFRESVKAILALKVPDAEQAEALRLLGIDPTILNAVNLAVGSRAQAGDVEAARYLRDTAGERPRDGLEIGNLDGRPLATMDLSAMTDDQLRALAAQRAGDDEEQQQDGDPG